jgi:iron complex outermembrane receptor protein
MSSGLIDNKYAIYGRFSRLLSDGYRNQAWADLWSYFFSAVRFDNKMTTKINIYGGPEKTHLTYDGISRDYLDGTITGDKETDRKYNPLSDPDDIDNTFQPHYELLTEYAVSDKMHFSNSVFYTSALGYYRNIKYSRDLFEYDLEPFSTSDPAPYLGFANFSEPDPVTGLSEIESTDLVRRRWIDNAQWGVIPRFEIQHSGGSVTAGVEIRMHTAKHWGEVLWTPVPFPNLTHNHRYYDYNVDKNSYSAFIHESYIPFEGITLMADLQYAYHKYSFYNDKRNNIEFDTDYNFFSPRFGVNYNVSGNLNVFGNFSVAQREPTFRSIYDAQYAYSTPLFSGNDYNNPMIKPEKMYDYETGLGYNSSKFTAKANLYYMDFRNELVRWGGQVDEEGIAVAGNAKKSYHAGVELSAAYEIIPELTINANITQSVNKFVEHSEFENDWSTWPPGIIEKNYDDNVIGGFPSTIFNGTALFRREGLMGRLHLQYIGKQFLDNSENDRKKPELRNNVGYGDKVIDPYILVNLRFTYNMPDLFGLKSLDFSISIYNLLDAEYVVAGYIDGIYIDDEYIDNIPFWIPGAKRNYFAGFNIEM